MTTPITGPFTKSEVINDIPHWSNGTTGAKAYRLTRKWYRQAKPYNLPLEFDSITRFGKSRYASSGPYGTWNGSSQDASVFIPDSTVQRPDIYNQAYARFRDAMGAAVELGVATAEGRQALSMVTRRLGQIANFTRHVATGRLGLAAGDLGLSWGAASKKFKSRLPEKYNPQSNRARESARSFSSVYLEFHFGWKPLIADIHDGLEVLEKPLKPHRVVGSATASYPDDLNFTRIDRKSVV